MCLVRDFNLFPGVTNLLTLERKYGDALVFEDLNGFRQTKKKRSRGPNSDSGIETSDSKSKNGTTVNSS